MQCIRSERWAIFSTPGNSAGRTPVQAGSALQRRNPLLLLLLYGLLLLRYDTRQLVALLFQLPPRNSLLSALTSGNNHFPLPLLIRKLYIPEYTIYQFLGMACG